MKIPFRFAIVALLGMSLLGAIPSARAADDNNQPTVPMRTLVTITSKGGPPEITRQDVLVLQDKTRLVVTDVQPATGKLGGLQLAIVIDDACSSSLNNQLTDIAKFIRGLGPETQVGLFYARNGAVQVVQDFTADHDAAAKALRIPLGRAMAYSSIYLSAMDLMKRWLPTQERREMFLIGDGIDRFRGDPFSPDVQSTYEAAQKAGIMLHSIFANAAGHWSMNMWHISMGQSNLSQITDETGGEAYFQGSYTPIDFAPFMSQFDKVLHSQYWISYLAHPKKKAQLQRIRFTTELPGVDISAPEQVFVPGSNQ